LDENENIKIGDFGLGRALSSQSHFAYTGVGTPLYISPEMVQEQPYNEKSDIWALGCLMYELASKKPPFMASNQIALAK
jgi:NIMA (never in mitosis gene a)-related kinase